MRLKLPKLASLAKKTGTLWLQFIDAFFASKGYRFKNIFGTHQFRFNCYRNRDHSQQARYVKTTSYQRRCDVMTSLRRIGVDTMLF